MNGRRTAYGWAAALLCGALLRLIFLRHHPHFSGDALIYGDLAHNMIAHRIFGFSENPIRSTLIRLPGYPLFLAACFLLFGDGNYLAVVWIQVLVDLASCVLIGELARRIGGRRCGLAAVWLAALCPFTANYSVVVLTETVSIFSVALAFVAFERWCARWRVGQASAMWAVILGLALSFAVLVRPDQGLLAAAILPTMLWVSVLQKERSIRSRFAPVLLSSLVIVVPLTIWTARNWKTFHVFQPLAPRFANDPGEFVPRGFQRWYRTWAIEYKSTFDVYWNYDNNPLSLTDVPPRAFDNPTQRAQTRAVFDQYNDVTTATPEFDTQFNRIAAERIAEHPMRYYVLLPSARLLDMWVRPRTELMKLPTDWWNVKAHPRRSAEEFAYGLIDVAYLTLAIVGMGRWRSKRWSGNGVIAFAMFSFVALRCALLMTIDNSEPRYTLECFPIVLVLAGLAVCSRFENAND